MPADRRRRTLLIVLIAAGALVVAGVVALVMLLGPVDQSRAETPVPTPSTTPTPTPTPTATAAARGEVALGAEGFELQAADGEMFTFRWSDEPSDAVEALTAAFGSDPVEGVQEGDGSHFPDYTVWAWPGFEFASMVEAPGGKTREEYDGPAWVRISENTVAEVDVTAEFGLAIGMSVDDVRAAGPDDEYPSRFEDGLVFILAQDRSISPSGDDAQPQRVSVFVYAAEPDGIYRIVYMNDTSGL
jgi:hypothetical protein